MGFIPAVRRILDDTSETRHTMLFSATLEGDVGKLIKQYQTDPVRHSVGSGAPDLTATQHHFWEIPRPERIALCASVIATFGSTIVFTRTRHGADRAARQLKQVGISAAAIHGNRSQAQRTRALHEFASGKALALVATDVAARGIHVDGVECVVHYDPVDEDSAYIHRSGRTARAGAEGHVVSFIDPSQVKLVKAMKRRLNLSQEISAPPAMDGPVVSVPTEPVYSGEAPARRNGKHAPRGASPKNRSNSSRRNGHAAKNQHSKNKSKHRNRQPRVQRCHTATPEFCRSRPATLALSSRANRIARTEPSAHSAHLFHKKVARHRERPGVLQHEEMASLKHLKSRILDTSNNRF